MFGRVARPAHRRAARRVAALGALLLVSVPVIPASAGDNRAEAIQDGWWNRAQGPAEGEPDGNPVRPLVPALPKPPTVPADAIAVGVTAGEVDKVAAVGMELTLAEGASLETLSLQLKEIGTGGATMGADRVRVVACPATGPWGPTQNGDWRDRPPADCELGSVEGVRGDDGTWTFDLSAIGRLWADPFAPLPQNGVVLSLDPAASPPVAQVSWSNVDSGGVRLTLAPTPPAPGPATGAPAFDPEPLAAATPDPVPAAPAADPAPGPALPAGSPGPFAFPSSGPGPTLPTPADEPVPAGADPEPLAEVTLAAPAAAPRPVAEGGPGVGFWERIPGSTVLLVPVAIGIAGLIGVTLGPGGRPAPVMAREGGLSRALARRDASGDGHA